MATPVGFTLPSDFTISTTTSVPCIVMAAASPKPLKFSDRTLYLRMTLVEMYFLANYVMTNSSETQQLSYFLQDSLRKDYQTWSNGKFYNVTLTRVQHPLWNQQSAFNQWPVNPGPGCSIVDFVATFTSNLTALERTAVVQGTYAKALSSNRGGGSLRGRYGSNPLATSRIGDVFYISPTNNVLLPTSACIVFSNENACRNGAYCAAINSQPTCICNPGYEGTYCEETSGTFLSTEWPAYQIVLVAIGALSVFALCIIFVCCCCSTTNRFFPPARSFDLDVARHRNLAQAYLNFPLPVVRRKIVRTKRRPVAMMMRPPPYSLHYTPNQLPPPPPPPQLYPYQQE